jgi:hypothetical protein
MAARSIAGGGGSGGGSGGGGPGMWGWVHQSGVGDERVGRFCLFQQVRSNWIGSDGTWQSTGFFFQFSLNNLNFEF